MSKRVRVRFAPSPTGGLHLGGMRTVLYNYLFAKQHKGDFVLRIEDTDQSRYVEGAEDYIFQCLEWCGLIPDESTRRPGEYAPYRQSERKPIYREYAQKLVDSGHAYYAFDTQQDLEQMRTQYKTESNPSPQYDHSLREKMKNSLSLSTSEVGQLLASNTPYVIRIKMTPGEKVSFNDLIRGEVSFDTSVVDDKVLLKADGMPTYHLAVVVDDHLMKITHAFRGEEWLPSAPVHIELWKHLFGLDVMPEWAHLPLILGPNGKLSKRDGAKYGFPVFAMNWTDPKSNELVRGFKEMGFLPEAFINLLALLGWNDGSEQELFSLEELTRKFSIDRVHSGGAKFDYEKAKWFNHEWIKKLSNAQLAPYVKDQLKTNGIDADPDQLITVIGLVKDRCNLLTDFQEQSAFFFRDPETPDLSAIKPKWNKDKHDFFVEYSQRLKSVEHVSAADAENMFKALATEKNIKAGELQLPLRIMLVGGKFGPPVFDIASIIGSAKTIYRIQHALNLLSQD